MASLDNFHVQNNGVRHHVAVPSAPVYGSSAGHRVQQMDLGGVPGRWDRWNRAPVATPLRPKDPFSRVHLGRDVPGQEWRTSHNPFQTSPYYVNLETQPTILPGGNAESWVLYQDTRPSLTRLLPFR